MSLSEEGEVSVSSLDEVEKEIENKSESQSREGVVINPPLSGKEKRGRKRKLAKARKRQSGKSKISKKKNIYEEFATNLHLLPEFTHLNQTPFSDREIMTYEEDIFSQNKKSNPTPSYHPLGQLTNKNLTEPDMDALVAANEGLDIFSNKRSPHELTLKEKRRRLKSLEYFRKQKLRKMGTDSLKPQAAVLPCKYYRDGLCNKGDECPFSHNIPQQRKQDVCKFYLSGNCNKGDTCLYMHSDYPCKFYHCGGCRKGTECKFSHSELTPQMKQLLEQQTISTVTPGEGFESTTTTSVNESPILGSTVPLFSKVNLSQTIKSEEVKLEFSDPYQPCGEAQPPSTSARSELPPQSGHLLASTPRVPFLFTQHSMRPPNTTNNCVKNNVPPHDIRAGHPQKIKRGLLATPPFPMYSGQQMVRHQHPHHVQPLQKRPLLSHTPSNSPNIQNLPTFSHYGAPPSNFRPHRPSHIFPNPSFHQYPRQPLLSSTHATRLQISSQHNVRASFDTSSSLDESKQTQPETKKDSPLSLSPLFTPLDSKALYFGASIDELLKMEEDSSLVEDDANICFKTESATDATSVSSSPVPSETADNFKKIDVEVYSHSSHDHTNDLLATFTESPSFAPPHQDAYLHLEIPWRLLSLDNTSPDSKVSYSKMEVPANLPYAFKDPRLRSNPNVKT